MESRFWVGEGQNGGETGPGGGGIGRDLLHQILSPFPSSETQHGACQVFASKMASTVSRYLIELAGALLGIREQMSLSPEEITTLDTAKGI